MSDKSELSTLWCLPRLGALAFADAALERAMLNMWHYSPVGTTTALRWKQMHAKMHSSASYQLQLGREWEAANRQANPSFTASSLPMSGGSYGRCR
jgi:hypothetical protein